MVYSNRFYIFFLDPHLSIGVRKLYFQISRKVPIDIERLKIIFEGFAKFNVQFIKIFKGMLSAPTKSFLRAVTIWLISIISISHLEICKLSVDLCCGFCVTFSSRACYLTFSYCLHISKNFENCLKYHFQFLNMGLVALVLDIFTSISKIIKLIIVLHERWIIFETFFFH